MAAYQALMVFVAAFSWIFLLSGVMKEQKDQPVILQEGKGLLADFQEDNDDSLTGLPDKPGPRQG